MGDPARRGLRIYDSEEPDLGFRYSVDVAGLNIGTPAQIQELATANSHLNNAHEAAMVARNADTADQHLAMIGNRKLPNHLAALRFLITAQALLLRRQPGPALDALGKAESNNPEMLCLDLFRGVAYNYLANWDMALKHLEAYRNLLGEDADICRELAEALRGFAVSRKPALVPQRPGLQSPGRQRVPGTGAWPGAEKNGTIWEPASPNCRTAAIISPSWLRTAGNLGMGWPGTDRPGHAKNRT